MKLRGLTKGAGSSAVQVASGLVAFYAHRMLSSRIALVQKKPLLAPAAIAVLGHVLKKSHKLSVIGASLCGVAGYAGAQVYELQKATANTVPPAPAGTSGFYDEDTGALTMAGDIGALTAAGDIGSLGYAATAGSAYNDAESL